MAAATLLHRLLVVCAVAAAFQQRSDRFYRLLPLRAALSPTEANENIRTVYDGVIDVRMSAEHRLEGRIVDSICIPAQLWEHGMYLPRDAFVPDVCEQFETDCRLLCVCGDGRRSELAAQQLANAGFSVDYIDGGLTAWAEQSLELEVEDDGGLVGSYV
jgi:rhodanese-related sulfurtransferase